MSDSTAKSSLPDWAVTIGIFSLIIIGLIVAIGLLGDKGRGGTGVDSTPTSSNENFTRVISQSAASISPGSDWLKGSEDDPVFGPDDASIVIMEFSDFECPFCQESYSIIRELVSTANKEIKFIYRDWPVDELHSNARLAAEAGQCANEQDKFWLFHDRLFQNQSNLSRDALEQYAQQSGLNRKEFVQCLDDGVFQAEVQADIDQGLKMGVVGTPTWFINGQKIEGVIPLSVWQEIINQL